MDVGEAGTKAGRAKGQTRVDDSRQFGDVRIDGNRIDSSKRSIFLLSNGRTYPSYPSVWVVVDLWRIAAGKSGHASHPSISNIPGAKVNQLRCTIGLGVEKPHSENSRVAVKSTADANAALASLGPAAKTSGSEATPFRNANASTVKSRLGRNRMRQPRNTKIAMLGNRSEWPVVGIPLSLDTRFVFSSLPPGSSRTRRRPQSPAASALRIPIDVVLYQVTLPSSPIESMISQTDLQ